MEKKKKSYNITNQRLARKKYISYSALQHCVQDFGIKNKWQYTNWIKKEKPLSIPKYPWRVYPEWTTWGDLLGTESIFIPFMKWKEMQKKTWKTYWEAARWVQKQNYKTAQEFYDAHKRGEIPDDIPRAPTQVYGKKYQNTWLGWKAFLGKNIQKKVEVMQNIQKLFAISGVPGYPNNYFRIIIASEGRDHLIEQLNTTAFRVYEYEEGSQSKLGTIVNAVASSQGGGLFLCNNMNNLFFELDSQFVYDRKLTEIIHKSIAAKKQQNY